LGSAHARGFEKRVEVPLRPRLMCAFQVFDEKPEPQLQAGRICFAR